VASTSCEAGPSAFDRPARVQGPEDTADAATLPLLPDAPDVETAGVATSPAPEKGARALVPEVRADTAPETEAAPEAVDPAADTFPDGRLHFEHPEHVRGIYLNAWAAGSTRRVGELLALARRTEINTFVIDIKDATGYVSHRSRVPLAREIGATGEIRIRDLPGLLHRLHDAGIYPIARIVIVKDPLLTAAHPELAVQDTAGGVFKDGKGIVWLNPYDTAMWAYPVALAREVARMGFPEIQWDYIRFPDIPAAEKARVVYPGAGDKPKAQAIHDFLAYSREELAPLGTKVTADVFGVTASVNRDVGIGQVWEFVIGAVDVALPMVYPSHYWDGSFGFETPNAHPYEIVRRALGDALRRSAEVEGAGNTRPWLQDFSLGKPAYGAPEVRAQIQATYDAGIQEWILWNPGSHYTEEALEPSAGFTSEPTMRVADRVVPVSQRTAVLDSVQAAEAAADSARAAERRARADSARAAERADSAARAESADTTAGPGDGEPPVPDTVPGNPGGGPIRR
jgi:hypothetical protein